MELMNPEDGGPIGEFCPCKKYAQVQLVPMQQSMSMQGM
jgi:hypothetical protein